MSKILSSTNPADLSENQILDNVSQVIFNREGCTEECIEYLNHIGYRYYTSSSRILFHNSNSVVKFAPNNRERENNEREYDVYNVYKEYDPILVAPISEVQRFDYRWIKMKKCSLDVTEEHISQLTNKLSELEIQADLIPENIGIWEDEVVLIDYPELFEQV